MADFGVFEICAAIAAISAGLGGPIAVVRWCAQAIGERVEDAKKELRLELEAVRHKGNNVATRVDAIERLRTSDVERIVKLETNLSNLEKGQLRIEHQLEKMEAGSAAERAEIIESLRELRTVTPRP